MKHAPSPFLSGKAKHSKSDVSLFPWLLEVHSKIWNCQDLHPQLFHEAEVMAAYYDALQLCLQKLCLNHNSIGYINNENVLKAKLDIQSEGSLQLPAAQPSLQLAHSNLACKMIKPWKTLMISMN